MRLRLSTLLATVTAAGCSGLTPVFATDEVSAPQDALPPLASAGPDREVLRALPVALDGSGSYHPAGKAFTVQWEQTSGPPVPLSSPREQRPMLVTPVAECELGFRITVDDGEQATSDSVTLFVRAAPRRKAPRVRAAGDHYASAVATTSPEDLLQVVPDTAVVTVAAVEPTIVPQLVPGEVGGGRFTVFEYEATADGLGSAPDYLALWVQDSTSRDQATPRAVVSAPRTVLPGESFVLDGSASLGDPQRWRWQQLAGDPALEDGAGRSVTVTAPWRPQELVFRLQVAGGYFESAPEDVTVVVAPEDGVAPPEPTPTAELRTHAGNVLWVDALAGGSASLEGVELEWWQTFGEHVSLTPLSPGRFVSFVAPAVATGVPDLALAVLARRAGVESAPAVTHVTIVGPEANDPPAPVLCSAAAVAGEPLVIYASVSDPEGDVIELRWVPSSETLVLTPVSAPPSSACERPWAPEPTWAEGTSTANLVVQLTAPTGAFSVTLEACDHLLECGTATLTFAAS